jgi:hypothetical protein
VRVLRCFRGNGGNSIPYRPLISVAAPDIHGSLPVVPLIADKRYYGEAPARFPGGSGAGWEEPGARGSTVWRAKLGSAGSPRRERQVKGQSRGTTWRVILQASSLETAKSPGELPSALAGKASNADPSVSVKSVKSVAEFIMLAADGSRRDLRTKRMRRLPSSATSYWRIARSLKWPDQSASGQDIPTYATSAEPQSPIPQVLRQFA